MNHHQQLEELQLDLRQTKDKRLFSVIERLWGYINTYKEDSLAGLCMGVSSGGKRPIYQLSNALFLVKSFHQNYPTILFSREVQFDIKHSCSMD